MIKSILRVRTIWSSRDGWSRVQGLEKVWLFANFPIWKKIIDEEEVPSFAIIENATLGFTNWKSKWNEMVGIYWKSYGGYEIRRPVS